MVNGIYRSALSRGLASSVLAASVVLAGCEAELHLEGVNKTLEQPIRRTDQFISVERAGTGEIVAFADVNTVVEGTVGDDGVSWQRVELSAEPAQNFIDSTACADGTVHGLSFENEIWTRTESGWVNHTVETPEQMQAVTCTESGVLWVVGAFGSLLSSEDGGESWNDASLGEDFTLTDVAFADADTGYAVGEFGTVVKTTDGGGYWEMLDPINDDLYPLSTYFSDADHGWVSGVLGLVMATEDGGMSWERQPSTTQASIYGFVAAGDDVYAYGDLGALLRFEDGTWVSQPAPEIPIHYAGAVPLSAGQLLLVGGWGVVMEVPLAARASGSQDMGAN